MGVQIQNHTSLFFSFKYLLFEVVRDRSDSLMSFFPSAVGINAGEFCSGVAVDDPVWVDHGYYFEDIVLVEGISLSRGS